MKPVLVTSGEPSGIGPDICLSLVNSPYPVVVLGDLRMLMERAKRLNLSMDFIEWHGQEVLANSPALYVWHVPCPVAVVPGVLEARNSTYVLNMLNLACDACSDGKAQAMVTAPVHKGIINDAGTWFQGHTEYLATRLGVKQVVMMLACKTFRVALITTHLPLVAVPSAITEARMSRVIETVHESLQLYFNIKTPRIKVAGLNPHAGEDGHLGREEVEVISPALIKLRQLGIDAQGPFSADTLFSKDNIANTDVFVAMYHDQGLPVLKYAGFGQAVNITLGLPIIRTSVDHGTALSIAGTNKANPESLLLAVETAAHMATCRVLA